MERTDLLILGAGPFGLAMARYARVHGIEHRILGHRMAFWRQHMPANMWLRSGSDWYLDPMGELTMPRYLRARGLAREALHPLTIERYLDYVDWFSHESGAQVRETRATTLRCQPDGTFVAGLEDGGTLCARRVLLAIGFHAFRHCPPDLVARLPEGRWHHTREFVDMRMGRDRRVLIIGGRQSAFEWAALLAEAGAAAVHVVHRHPTPQFAESDWSWVPGLLERLENNPSWFRGLPVEERKAIARRFWQEGRLKLEPWLPPRMPPEIVHDWPEAEVVSCTSGTGDAVRATLSSSDILDVDQFVLATGYRTDTERLGFLSAPIRDALRTDDGFPDLDTGFQSRVPGLYFTSMPAARDFGPYMGFTVSVPYTTRIIGRALQTQQGGEP